MDLKVMIDWKFVASCGAVILVCKFKANDAKDVLFHFIDATKECIVTNGQPS